MSRKILITGMNSRLGIRLKEKALDMGLAVAGVDLFPGAMNCTVCDLTNRASFENVMISEKPDAVIHTAAMTDVDGCEKDRDMARKVNVLATDNVAQVCKACEARMVYISTDYVFDGKNGPYSETDPVHPVQYYGETKLEGEEKVYAVLPDALTVRICVPYDWNTLAKPNFLMWLVSKLEAREKVKIVTDQWNTPTCMPHASEVILKLLEKGAKGIFHAAGRDFVHRYDFCLEACKVFGLDASLMEPCTSEGFKQVAARPMRGGLKCAKAEDFLSTKMLTASEGLELVRKLRK